MKAPKPRSLRSNTTADAGERIQKLLARGGHGSRREIESWISAGRILLNGRPAQLGERVRKGDRLQLDGRLIDWERYQQQPPRLLLYHKPTGELVSRRDPEGRPVVFSQLPRLREGRWIAIGRLDINTQGLLLLTNDGELAHRLMHPEQAIEREYAVRVLGEVSDAVLQRLQHGVTLEDGLARFETLVFAGGDGANKWYHVTVTEGRNRLVRRLWESQGLTVSRLIRLRYGSIVLPPGLKAGHYEELPQEALAALYQSVGLRLPAALREALKATTAAARAPAPAISQPRAARASSPRQRSPVR